MAEFPDIDVVELTADWKFEISKTGITGFRRFISSTAFSGSTLTHDIVKLPTVGDTWDSTFDNVYLQRIEVKYIENAPKLIGSIWEYKIYDCYYESNPVADIQNEINEMGSSGGTFIPNVDALLTNIETGGQFIQVELTDADADAGKGYKWKSDDEPTKQAVNFVVNTSNFKIQRDVTTWSTSGSPGWQEFLAVSKTIAGKVNSVQFLWCDPGTLLYHGASLQSYVSESGSIKFRIDMSFEYRSVTGVACTSAPTQDSESDGWNFVVREKRASTTANLWDRPYMMIGAVRHYLYGAASFQDLLMAGQEVPDIPALSSVNK